MLPAAQVHHPAMPGGESPESAGQEAFPSRGLGGPGRDGPPRGSGPGLAGPAKFRGHKFFKLAVGGGEQGLEICRAQELRPIPGQVPPGQKAQVQGAPGDAGPPAVILGGPDLKRQGHLGRQAPNGQVQGRALRQFGQAAGQLPLPPGPVLPAVAQGKGADLYGDQVRSQVVKEFPGPGLAPGVAVDRADEHQTITGDRFQMAFSLTRYLIKPTGPAW